MQLADTTSMVGKIGCLGIGDHICLMTLYQTQVIGTQAFTRQDVDTGVMLII